MILDLKDFLRISVCSFLNVEHSLFETLSSSGPFINIIESFQNSATTPRLFFLLNDTSSEISVTSTLPPFSYPGTVVYTIKLTISTLPSSASLLTYYSLILTGSVIPTSSLSTFSSLLHHVAPPLLGPLDRSKATSLTRTSTTDTVFKREKESYQSKESPQLLLETSTHLNLVLSTLTLRNSKSNPNPNLNKIEFAFPPIFEILLSCLNISDPSALDILLHDQIEGKSEHSGKTNNTHHPKSVLEKQIRQIDGGIRGQILLIIQRCVSNWSSMLEMIESESPYDDEVSDLDTCTQLVTCFSDFFKQKHEKLSSFVDFFSSFRVNICLKVLELLRSNCYCVLTKLLKDLNNSAELALNNFHAAKVLQPQLCKLVSCDIEELERSIPSIFQYLYLTWRHSQLIESPNSSAKLTFMVSKLICFRLANYICSPEMFSNIKAVLVPLISTLNTNDGIVLLEVALDIKERVLLSLKLLTIIKSVYVSARTRALSESSKFIWKPITSVLTFVDFFGERLTDLLFLVNITTALASVSRMSTNFSNGDAEFSKVSVLVINAFNLINSLLNSVNLSIGLVGKCDNWDQFFVDFRQSIRSFDAEFADVLKIFLSQTVFKLSIISQISIFELFLPVKLIGSSCALLVNRSLSELFESINTHLLNLKIDYSSFVLSLNSINEENLPTDCSISQRIASKLDSLVDLDVSALRVSFPFVYNKSAFFSNLFNFTVSFYKETSKMAQLIKNLSISHYFEDFYDHIKETNLPSHEGSDNQSLFQSEFSVYRSRRSSVASSVMNHLTNKPKPKLKSNFSISDLIDFIETITDDVGSFKSSCLEIMNTILSKFIAISDNISLYFNEFRTPTSPFLEFKEGAFSLSRNFSTANYLSRDYFDLSRSIKSSDCQSNLFFNLSEDFVSHALFVRTHHSKLSLLESCCKVYNDVSNLPSAIALLLSSHSDSLFELLSFLSNKVVGFADDQFSELCFELESVCGSITEIIDSINSLIDYIDCVSTIPPLKPVVNTHFDQFSSQIQSFINASSIKIQNITKTVISKLILIRDSVQLSLGSPFWLSFCCFIWNLFRKNLEMFSCGFFEKLSQYFCNILVFDLKFSANELYLDNHNSNQSTVSFLISLFFKSITNSLPQTTSQATGADFELLNSENELEFNNNQAQDLDESVVGLLNFGRSSPCVALAVEGVYSTLGEACDNTNICLDVVKNSLFKWQEYSSEQGSKMSSDSENIIDHLSKSIILRDDLLNSLNKAFNNVENNFVYSFIVYTKQCESSFLHLVSHTMSESFSIISDYVNQLLTETDLVFDSQERELLENVILNANNQDYFTFDTIFCSLSSYIKVKSWIESQSVSVIEQLDTLFDLIPSIGTYFDNTFTKLFEEFSKRKSFILSFSSVLSKFTSIIHPLLPNFIDSVFAKGQDHESLVLELSNVVSNNIGNGHVGLFNNVLTEFPSWTRIGSNNVINSTKKTNLTNAKQFLTTVLDRFPLNEFEMIEKFRKVLTELGSYMSFSFDHSYLANLLNNSSLFLTKLRNFLTFVQLLEDLLEFISSIDSTLFIDFEADSIISGLNKFKNEDDCLNKFIDDIIISIEDVNTVFLLFNSFTTKKSAENLLSKRYNIEINSVNISDLLLVFSNDEQFSNAYNDLFRLSEYLSISSFIETSRCRFSNFILETKSVNFNIMKESCLDCCLQAHPELLSKYSAFLTTLPSKFQLNFITLPCSLLVTASYPKFRDIFIDELSNIHEKFTTSKFSHPELIVYNTELTVSKQSIEKLYFVVENLDFVFIILSLLSNLQFTIDTTQVESFLSMRASVCAVLSTITSSHDIIDAMTFTSINIDSIFDLLETQLPLLTSQLVQISSYLSLIPVFDFFPFFAKLLLSIRTNISFPIQFASIIPGVESLKLEYRSNLIKLISFTVNSKEILLVKELHFESSNSSSIINELFTSIENELLLFFKNSINEESDTDFEDFEEESSLPLCFSFFKGKSTIDNILKSINNSNFLPELPKLPGLCHFSLLNSPNFCLLGDGELFVDGSSLQPPCLKFPKSFFESISKSSVLIICHDLINNAINDLMVFSYQKTCLFVFINSPDYLVKNQNILLIPNRIVVLFLSGRFSDLSPQIQDFIKLVPKNLIIVSKCLLPKSISKLFSATFEYGSKELKHANGLQIFKDADLETPSLSPHLSSICKILTTISSDNYPTSNYLKALLSSSSNPTEVPSIFVKDCINSILTNFNTIVFNVGNPCFLSELLSLPLMTISDFTSTAQLNSIIEYDQSCVISINVFNSKLFSVLNKRHLSKHKTLLCLYDLPLDLVSSSFLNCPLFNLNNSKINTNFSKSILFVPNTCPSVVDLTKGQYSSTFLASKSVFAPVYNTKYTTVKSVSKSLRGVSLDQIFKFISEHVIRMTSRDHNLPCEILYPKYSAFLVMIFLDCDEADMIVLSYLLAHSGKYNTSPQLSDYIRFVFAQDNLNTPQSSLLSPTLAYTITPFKAQNLQVSPEIFNFLSVLEQLLTLKWSEESSLWAESFNVAVSDLNLELTRLIHQICLLIATFAQLYPKVFNTLPHLFYLFDFLASFKPKCGRGKIFNCIIPFICSKLGSIACGYETYLSDCFNITNDLIQITCQIFNSNHLFEVKSVETELDYCLFYGRYLPILEGTDFDMRCEFSSDNMNFGCITDQDSLFSYFEVLFSCILPENSVILPSFLTLIPCIQSFCLACPLSTYSPAFSIQGPSFSGRRTVLNALKFVCSDSILIDAATLRVKIDPHLKIWTCQSELTHLTTLLTHQFTQFMPLLTADNISHGIMNLVHVLSLNTELTCCIGAYAWVPNLMTSWLESLTSSRKVLRGALSGLHKDNRFSQLANHLDFLQQRYSLTKSNDLTSEVPNILSRIGECQLLMDEIPKTLENLLMEQEDLRSSLVSTTGQISSIKDYYEPYLAIAHEALESAFDTNSLAGLYSVARPTPMMLVLAKVVLYLISDSTMELSESSMRWSTFRLLLLSLDKLHDKLSNLDLAKLPDRVVSSAISTLERINVYMEPQSLPSTPLRQRRSLPHYAKTLKLMGMNVAPCFATDGDDFDMSGVGHLLVYACCSLKAAFGLKELDVLNQRQAEYFQNLENTGTDLVACLQHKELLTAELNQLNSRFDCYLVDSMMKTREIEGNLPFLTAISNSIKHFGLLKQHLQRIKSDLNQSLSIGLFCLRCFSSMILYYSESSQVSNIMSTIIEDLKNRALLCEESQTKLVQSYLNNGIDNSEIITRIQNDVYSYTQLSTQLLSLLEDLKSYSSTSDYFSLESLLQNCCTVAEELLTLKI
ncbi:hypothetical protein P9112_007311 [Eukaryota sp. TZLM1-RC]